MTNKRRRLVQLESSDEDGGVGKAAAQDDSSASSQSSSSDDGSSDGSGSDTSVTGSDSEASDSEEQSASSGSDEDAESSESEEGQDADEEEEEEEGHKHNAKKKRRLKRQQLRRTHTNKAVLQENERTDLAFPDQKRFEPKPMVELKAGSNVWYQAYVIKESANEVKIEVPGVNGKRKPLLEWLKKGSSRIWRGSLRAEHWRHLGKGSWEPKIPGNAKRTRAGSSGKRTNQQAQQHRSAQPSGQSAGCSTEHNSKPTGYEDEVMSPRPAAATGRQQPNSRPPRAGGAQAADASTGINKKRKAVEGPSLSDQEHASNHSPAVGESHGVCADQSSARVGSALEDIGGEVVAPSSRTAGHHGAAGTAGGSSAVPGGPLGDPLTRWFMKHMAALATTGMLCLVPDGSMESGALPPGFTYDPTTRSVLLQPPTAHAAGLSSNQADSAHPSPAAGAAAAGVQGTGTAAAAGASHIAASNASRHAPGQQQQQQGGGKGVAGGVGTTARGAGTQGAGIAGPGDGQVLPSTDNQPSPVKKGLGGATTSAAAGTVVVGKGAGAGAQARAQVKVEGGDGKGVGGGGDVGGKAHGRGMGNGPDGKVKQEEGVQGHTQQKQASAVGEQQQQRGNGKEGGKAAGRATDGAGGAGARQKVVGAEGEKRPVKMAVGVDKVGDKGADRGGVPSHAAGGEGGWTSNTPMSIGRSGAQQQQQQQPGQKEKEREVHIGAAALTGKDESVEEPANHQQSTNHNHHVLHPPPRAFSGGHDDGPGKPLEEVGSTEPITALNATHSQQPPVQQHGDQSGDGATLVRRHSLGGGRSQQGDGRASGGGVSLGDDDGKGSSQQGSGKGGGGGGATQGKPADKVTSGAKDRGGGGSASGGAAKRSGGGGGGGGGPPRVSPPPKAVRRSVIMAEDSDEEDEPSRQPSTLSSPTGAASNPSQPLPPPQQQQQQQPPPMLQGDGSSPTNAAVTAGSPKGGQSQPASRPPTPPRGGSAPPHPPPPQTAPPTSTVPADNRQPTTDTTAKAGSGDKPSPRPLPAPQPSGKAADSTAPTAKIDIITTKMHPRDYLRSGRDSDDGRPRQPGSRAGSKASSPAPAHNVDGAVEKLPEDVVKPLSRQSSGAFAPRSKDPGASPLPPPPPPPTGEDAGANSGGHKGGEAGGTGSRAKGQSNGNEEGIDGKGALSKVPKGRASPAVSGHDHAPGASALGAPSGVVDGDGRKDTSPSAPPPPPAPPAKLAA